MHHQDRWTPRQEETIQLFKQLQKSGLGYRKIANTYTSNDKDWDWEISLRIYHPDPQNYLTNHQQ